MEDKALIVAFENYRATVLSLFVKEPSSVSASLAYALYNRVAPIFNQNIEREVYGTDPFEPIYAVKSDFVDEVTKLIDELDLAKNHKDMAFYSLEGKFKGKRMELIHTIEYARIDGRFNDKVYAAIEANAPMEANKLDKEFLPKDVYFG